MKNDLAFYKRQKKLALTRLGESTLKQDTNRMIGAQIDCDHLDDCMRQLTIRRKVPYVPE